MVDILEQRMRIVDTYSYRDEGLLSLTYSTLCKWGLSKCIFVIMAIFENVLFKFKEFKRVAHILFLLDFEDCDNLHGHPN